ncbi:hypothetical protein [Pseudoxanthomonas sp. GM95]|uniref:hypothetical protein n=1 Tax=Pseudoxanthomonas sp. GM95 TaxID=1881043 RepID=UPI0011142BB2|nr:hypothetical protein [Pseudoxanthomonas sp. GM95]
MQDETSSSAYMPPSALILGQPPRSERTTPARSLKRIAADIVIGALVFPLIGSVAYGLAATGALFLHQWSVKTLTGQNAAGLQPSLLAILPAVIVCGFASLFFLPIWGALAGSLRAHLSSTRWGKMLFALSSGLWPLLPGWHFGLFIPGSWTGVLLIASLPAVICVYGLALLFARPQRVRQPVDPT